MAKGAATWKRVKFGEVVRLNKETCKDPGSAGIERVIGLEHLEPGDLRVRSWGDVADGTTFTNRVRPGQVLFGKRRAYQRKIAVAAFDAICSGDIYVLESANPSKLLPELLPFICQTDSFFEHAVGTSAGSLSPRTNWSSLAEYEFALPPLEEQRRLVTVLQGVEDVIEARRRVVEVSRSLLRSTIDAGFTGSLSSGGSTTTVDGVGEIPSRWRVSTLDEVTTKIVDGVHKRPDYVTSGVPFLAIENLTRGPGIDFSQTRFVTEADHREFSRRAPVERGDVLVSKDGTLGIARVVETSREFSIFVSLAVLKPLHGTLDPWFLRYYFDSTMFLRRLAQKASGSALKHIHLVDFRAARMPVPPYAEQVSISNAVKDTEAAYLGSLAAVADTQALKRAVLGQLAWRQP